MEILPGKYMGKCWNNESIYILDEIFHYIAPVIEKYYPQYDLWGISEISRETWLLILQDLEQLQGLLDSDPTMEDLTDQIGFFYSHSKTLFGENLTQHVNDLSNLIREFQHWIKQKLEDHDVISILGI